MGRTKGKNGRAFIAISIRMRIHKKNSSSMTPSRTWKKTNKKQRLEAMLKFLIVMYIGPMIFRDRGKRTELAEYTGPVKRNCIFQSSNGNVFL